MADPLRRTLSKLRGRRSQRGATGAGEAAGHTDGRGDGALRCKGQPSPRAPGHDARGAPGVLLGSRAGCYRVLVSPLEEPRLSESAGWSRRGDVAPSGEGLLAAPVACPSPTAVPREGTTLPPPSPPGLRAPLPPPAELCFSASVFPGGADSGSPAERAGGGGGSEEEDYYDNQRLPGWGCQGACGAQAEPRGNKEGGEGGSSHRARARESTGRLRSQLQEAYYLLIHAMHDLPPASPAVEPRSPQPAGRSPARAVEPGDVAHRDGRSRLQGVVGPGCPGSAKGPAWRQGISKSLESLLAAVPSAKPPPLPRCRSDSALRALLREPMAPQGHLPQEPGTRREAASPAAAAQRPGDHSCRGGRSACGALPSAAEDGEGQLLLAKGALEPDAALAEAVPLGGAVEDPAAAAAGHSGQQHPLADTAEGPFKPPAVTVRKLQKWMYKGRLLSLGIKGRGSAAGPPSPSSSKASGTRTLLLGRDEGSTTVPSPAHMRGPFNKTLGAPSDQRILLTDLIENVYIPSVSRREFKNFNSSEMAERKPRIASITVSKKQNWLHQSSPRTPNLEKGSYHKKMSRETHQVLGSPSPLLDPKMPQTFPRRDGSAHATVNGASHLALRNRTLEFGEDNDADDEGEIWYNPIPEDETDFPCFVHNNGDNSDSQAMNCKISSANDLIKVVVHNEDHPQSFSYTGDAQSRETSQVSCVHSVEHLQVQKPKPACTILSGFVTEDSSTLKGSSGGPGILSASKTETGAAECSPSSPNPSKKGGSINWSFPDKIKSPRTVRKLSIKMKKLPELSRKLSVKGNSSHNSSDNSSLLKNNCQDIGHASLPSSGNMTSAASRNVISRYHLDSSVSSQHNYKKKSSGSSKSSSKGGYLSDGDSPELITKSGKHAAESRAGKGKEAFPNNNGSKTEIDIDAFRHYSFSDQPKCSQYISGLMSIHFYGAEDLKPPRMDSKDVFCAIQVDSVNKARTALLTCRTTFLDMDHTFNIEIENAQHLKLVVFSWEPMPRKNRVCCYGTVVLPALFRVTKTHQLAVKLEPRGLIYVKLTLLEQWENSLNGLDGEQEPVIFGVDVRKVVEKENVGLMVPLLMKKCIMEIEKRGCQVVGLYRLCGSAAVKKELREAFEKDSKAVTLCETQYPDINVITGVLKDYLRELPSPLITKQLYEAVLDAMVKNPLKMTAAGCDNDPSDSEHTVSLLDCLPDIEKATLRMLLDHLKLVASYHEINRMTCQNLAVCFGPVLLSQRQETANHNNRVFMDSEELASALDFKKHIEVLHYLLQLWPVQRSAAKESALPEQQSSVNYLRPKKQRPHMLNLNSTEISGILRSRPARLDSPSSNRYAGDWSGCGENYFVNPKEVPSEADYDDVPSEDAESGDDGSRADRSDKLIEQPNCMSKEHTFQAYLAMQTMDSSVNHRVNLKDLQESIDTLIGNLERELNKNKLNIRY
ncbi:rho GTPase-activating protein SYDE2 [Paroedura picta]|uniref:rho GTPase-activating protein SYDE2 n=1 Tax=Paroedura picta TaxID=143630 RepID=UPI004056C60D